MEKARPSWRSPRRDSGDSSCEPVGFIKALSSQGIGESLRAFPERAVDQICLDPPRFPDEARKVQARRGSLQAAVQPLPQLRWKRAETVACSDDSLPGLVRSADALQPTIQVQPFQAPAQANARQRVLSAEKMNRGGSHQSLNLLTVPGSRSPRGEDLENNPVESVPSGRVGTPGERNVSCDASSRLSWFSSGDGWLSTASAAHMDNTGSWLQSRAVFPDSEGMKEKVRENLMNEAFNFNAAEHYKETGFCQRLARSQRFENFTLLVIVMNGIWLAIDADKNTAEVNYEGPLGFQVAEHAFCVYFFLEWLVRFLAYRVKMDILLDHWFVFDTVLMILMVVETWVLTIIIAVFGGSSGLRGSTTLRVVRLLRLTRMARMAKLLRALPELMILIKGMCAAFRSVFLTLCLLVLVMYIFAIAFTQLTRNTAVGARYFDSVVESMYTLLIRGTLLDNVGIVVRELGDESVWTAGLFLVFVLLAALTIMNMLIGVLCEVVSVVAAVEKEELAVAFVKRKLEDIIKALDKDGNNQISKVEFEDILANPEAAKALKEVNVDVMGLVDLADFIFEDSRLTCSSDRGDAQLEFPQFMEVVLQLRGTNTATVKDIVSLRKTLRQMSIETMSQLEMNSMRLARIEEKLTAFSDPSRRGRESNSRCGLSGQGNRRTSPPKQPGPTTPGGVVVHCGLAKLGSSPLETAGSKASLSCTSTRPTLGSTNGSGESCKTTLEQQGDCRQPSREGASRSCRDEVARVVDGPPQRERSSTDPQAEPACAPGRPRGGSEELEGGGEEPPPALRHERSERSVDKELSRSSEFDHKGSDKSNRSTRPPSRSKTWCSHRPCKEPPATPHLSVVVRTTSRSAHNDKEAANSPRQSLAHRASQLENTLSKGLTDLHKILTELDSRMDRECSELKEPVANESPPLEDCGSSWELSHFRSHISLPAMCRIFKVPGQPESPVCPGGSPRKGSKSGSPRKGSKGGSPRKSPIVRPRLESGEESEDKSDAEVGDLHHRMQRLGDAVTGGLLRLQRRRDSPTRPRTPQPPSCTPPPF